LGEVGVRSFLVADDMLKGGAAEEDQDTLEGTNALDGN
jgi:hypothetical protein